MEFRICRVCNRCDYDLIEKIADKLAFYAGIGVEGVAAVISEMLRLAAIIPTSLSCAWLILHDARRVKIMEKQLSNSWTVAAVVGYRDFDDVGVIALSVSERDNVKRSIENLKYTLAFIGHREFIEKLEEVLRDSGFIVQGDAEGGEA